MPTHIWPNAPRWQRSGDQRDTAQNVRYEERRLTQDESEGTMERHVLHLRSAPITSRKADSNADFLHLDVTLAVLAAVVSGHRQDRPALRDPPVKV